MPTPVALPRPCLLLLVLLLSIGTARSQSDSTQRNGLLRLADNLFGEGHDPEKPHFLVYPTLAYTPETSFEFGLSALYLFHAKGDYENNRLSEFNAFTFITLERQYGLWLDHAVYGDDDRWISLGRLRWQRFPLLYFGIGPEVSGEFPAIADADYLLFRERLLAQTLPNLFVGLSIDFQYLYNVDFQLDPERILPLPVGSDGSLTLGLGSSVVYDTRQNVLNERDALYAEASFQEYSPLWGSEYSFRSLTLDFRGFFPITADKKQVLAVQAFGNFLGGDSIPFQQLSLLGNESLLRGYYTGRYRDNHYLAAQVEYRFLPFPFAKRLGAAAFFGAGTVAPNIGDLRLDRLRPAGGAGIRFLLFPDKDIFVRFDVALTPEGPNYYFFTGEAF
jgi:hypothetical protein